MLIILYFFSASLPSQVILNKNLYLAFLTDYQHFTVVRQSILAKSLGSFFHFSAISQN